MRLRITYSAGYRYAPEAAASCVEARLLAAPTPGQRVQTTALDSDPTGWKLAFTDYWGTPTVTLHQWEAHPELALVGTSVVDVVAPEPMPALTWAEVCADDVQDRYAEFCDAEVDPALESAVAEAKSAATPGEAACALASRPGMSADSLLVALRGAGIPARLVGGVVVDADALAVGASVDVEPHSWVEFFDGAWRGLDPAAGGPVGDGHLVMAFGQERADLAPLRGIYGGSGTSESYHQITVKRLS